MGSGRSRKEPRAATDGVAGWAGVIAHMPIAGDKPEGCGGHRPGNEGPRPTGPKLGHGEWPNPTGATYRDRRRRRIGGRNRSEAITSPRNGAQAPLEGWAGVIDPKPIPDPVMGHKLRWRDMHDICTDIIRKRPPKIGNIDRLILRA